MCQGRNVYQPHGVTSGWYLRARPLIRTMIPMLKIAGVALVAALSACSLYSSDDVEVGPDAAVVQVDAAADAPPTSATFRAAWSCSSAECASPLAASDRATLYTDGGAVRVLWYRDGDPAPMGEHAGMTAGACSDVPRDVEAGRSAYQLCPVDNAPTLALTAEIAWGTSQWSVTLMPL